LIYPYERGVKLEEEIVNMYDDENMSKLWELIRETGNALGFLRLINMGSISLSC